MKKKLPVLCLVMVLTMFFKSVSAQYYFYNKDYYDTPWLYEFGGSLGAMNCLTDLGGVKGIGEKWFKDLNVGKTHFNAGAFFQATYKNAAGIRLEVTFGKISANDNVLKGVTDIAKERFNRNLHFRSNIQEVALLAELHPIFMFIDWPAKDVSPPIYSPYLLAGIGYFSFNPQTMLNNKWIDLQPLSTEGQGFPEYPDRPVYKLKQMNLPFGGGIRVEVDPLINVRLEFLYRFLQTDYLDDLSTDYIDPSLFAKNGFTGTKLNNALLLYDRQIEKRATIGGKRGTPTEDDGYFTLNFKVNFVLGRERQR